MSNFDFFRDNAKQDVNMLFFRPICVVISAAGLACVFMTSHALAQVQPVAPAAGNRPTVPANRAAIPQQRGTTAPRAAAPAANPANPANRAPVGAAAAQPPQPANPFKLTKEQQARLNQLLGFWETNSSKVKTYSCEFTRFDYNQVFGPQNPKTPLSKSEGTIRYAAPDKGEFKVDTIAKYKPGVAGGEPQFPKAPAGHDEHWICDGRSVFEFKANSKQLVEEKLPPEMQGNAIAEGPLPFMFGAKRQKLLARYWMKELVPPAAADGKPRQGEYWFDVRPKTRADAANFQRIMVILDEKEFLPKAMIIYPPGFGPKSWSRQSYTFANRKVNHPLQRNQNWLGRFISPQVPRGWKKVVHNFGQPRPGAAPIRVATPPAAPRIPATGQPTRPGQPR